MKIEPIGLLVLAVGCLGWLIGPTFAIFVFVGFTLLGAAARNRGLPLKILDVDRPASTQPDGDSLVLSRPDQHVAWRSNRLPGDFSRRLVGSAVLRSRRDNT